MMKIRASADVSPDFSGLLLLYLTSLVLVHSHRCHQHSFQSPQAAVSSEEALKTYSKASSTNQTELAMS